MKAFLAPFGLEDETRREIKSHRQSQILGEWGRLFLVEGVQHLHFSQNTWSNPVWIDFTSISEAAQKLKKINKLWGSYSFDYHRRAMLIQQQLKSPSDKPIAFLTPVKYPNLGSWTLINKNKILASAECSSPFINGELHFIENKKDPPSRAYLKLWEWFTLHGRHPHKNQNCLDLGSSPGGWTWVLSELDCRVYSVDKAPLQEALNKRKNIHRIEQDAFSLAPHDVPPIDWLFSDIICDPRRLLELIEKWPVKNMVLTLKFKGKADFALIQKFSDIPNSSLIHLSHNKHELTWSKIELA